MKYPFSWDVLDKVSKTSIGINDSLIKLVCEVLLKIKIDKIDAERSYIEINEHGSPYVEIKVYSSRDFLVPIEVCMFDNEVELNVGKAAAVESFTIKTEGDGENLRKAFSKWLEHKVKEISFIKGGKIFKTIYKYFDGKKFRSLYFEINMTQLFWIGRKEEKVYEPWID